MTEERPPFEHRPIYHLPFYGYPFANGLVFFAVGVLAVSGLLSIIAGLVAIKCG